MINSYLERYFDFFETKNIPPEYKKANLTQETCLEEKIKIIEDNKGKKALISKKNFQNKYLLGIIIPKDDKAFGLGVIKIPKCKYYFPIFYHELSELIISDK
jgi:hypothetical protein